MVDIKTQWIECRYEDGRPRPIEKCNAYRRRWGLEPIPQPLNVHASAPDHNKKPRGLGDTVAAFTKATGIDRVVKTLAGGDCGCKERQERLNELFPYGASQ
jgi:hypothetical protein